MAIDPRADVVKGMLDQTGKSARWLAKQMGINHTSVTKWVDGENSPRDESVWDRMMIILRGAQSEQFKGVPLPTLSTKMVRINVVGRVAAGEGEYNVDPEDHGIYVPANLGGPDHLGYVVTGDSMMPALEDGDVAVFRPSSAPRRKLAFLVKSPDGSFKVKKMGWSESENRWVMQSLNPTYPPEPMDGHQVVGYLIGFYRAHGSYEKIEADLHGLQID